VPYDTVLYEKIDGVAILTFNRPAAMNAHNYQMKTEVQAASQEALNDPEVRVLVITGAGRGFHAGEDVKEVFLGQDIDRLKRDRLLALVGTIDTDTWTSQVNPKYFYGFPKPTIAAVNGPAVGAGLSIAVSCDIRIGTDQAGFGYLYTRRGLMGPRRAVTMLVQLMGPSRALEMMLSGEMIRAEEALRRGLLSRIVPQDQLIDQSLEVAHKLMAGAPLAQQAIKATFYKSLYDPEGLEDFNARVEAALIETEDHLEGARAFLERRTPVWAAR
jgi:enoyl-CoA hydratase/carnithine racemase